MSALLLARSTRPNSGSALPESRSRRRRFDECMNRLYALGNTLGSDLIDVPSSTLLSDPSKRRSPTGGCLPRSLPCGSIE
jgi:hypothetical protein